jgi:hypothetical protein
MAYTVQKPNNATPAALTYEAGVSSDTFQNSGAEYLHIKTGGTGTTVTVDCPNQCSFGVINSAHDISVVIGTNTDRIIGPFDPMKFNDASGLVTVGLSSTATVTLAVIGKP